MEFREDFGSELGREFRAMPGQGLIAVLLAPFGDIVSGDVAKLAAEGFGRVADDFCDLFVGKDDLKRHHRLGIACVIFGDSFEDQCSKQFSLVAAHVFRGVKRGCQPFAVQLHSEPVFPVAGSADQIGVCIGNQGDRKNEADGGGDEEIGKSHDSKRRFSKPLGGLKRRLRSIRIGG